MNTKLYYNIKSTTDQFNSERDMFSMTSTIHLPISNNPTRIVLQSNKKHYDHKYLWMLESTTKIPFDHVPEQLTRLGDKRRFSDTNTSYSSASSANDAQTTSSYHEPGHFCDTHPDMLQPVWADPQKVKENPTRYHYLTSYLSQYNLSFQSHLPLIKPCTVYFSQLVSSNYLSNIQPVFDCDTVWNFSSHWRQFKLFKKPSQLSTLENIYCFIKGVQPMWEDPANRHGGRLLITVQQQLDQVFEWLLCAFIGGHLFSSGVVGLIVSKRENRGDRIEIWLDNTFISETTHVFK